MRIISAAPSNTEILYRLGKEDEIVATTSLCDYPEEARMKDSIGGWSDDADLEKVKEKDPDVVLTSDRLQEDFKDRLEDAGVKTVHLSPESLHEVYSSIERIGEEVGKHGKAKTIVENMKQRIKKTDLCGKRIYCEEWSKPPMVSGNWIPDLIERCGGEYFPAEGRSRELTQAEIADFDPEIIVLNVCGAGEKADTETISGRDSWQEITAVENDAVFVIDDSLLNRPGPRLAEGVERIEELIQDV